MEETDRVNSGVLITGAGGMLGQAMLEAWSDRSPIGLDRQQLDVTDPEAVDRTIQRHRPVVLINCAAMTNVDECETRQAEAEAVNGIAVGSLARAAQAIGATFVHFSTDFVFDGRQVDGYDEQMVPKNPVNVYGLTKLHGEQALQSLQTEAFLVRTAWLYGRGGKNFVDTMLRLGRERTTLRVVNDQTGNPTLTNDVAQFVRHLVDDRAPSGLYHAVNEGSVNRAEFAERIFREAKLSTRVQSCSSAEYPLPARRPSWSRLINTKRPPLRHWSAALRDYLTGLGYA